MQQASQQPDVTPTSLCRLFMNLISQHSPLVKAMRPADWVLALRPALENIARSDNIVEEMEALHGLLVAAGTASAQYIVKTLRGAIVDVALSAVERGPQLSAEEARQQWESASGYPASAPLCLLLYALKHTPVGVGPVRVHEALMAAVKILADQGNIADVRGLSQADLV